MIKLKYYHHLLENMCSVKEKTNAEQGKRACRPEKIPAGSEKGRSEVCGYAPQPEGLRDGTQVLSR